MLSERDYMSKEIGNEKYRPAVVKQPEVVAKQNINFNLYIPFGRRISMIIHHIWNWYVNICEGL